MRGQVAENPAVALALEEPRGAILRIHPMRREADSLNHPADGARTHQLAGLRDRLALVTFDEDGIDAFRLRLHAAKLRELFERRRAGLVDHEVLAVAHDRDTESRALAGDGGADDERDAVIFQDTARIVDASRLRVSLGERLGLRVLGRVKRD